MKSLAAATPSLMCPCALDYANYCADLPYCYCAVARVHKGPFSPLGKCPGPRDGAPTLLTPETQTYRMQLPFRRQTNNLSQ